MKKHIFLLILCLLVLLNSAEAQEKGGALDNPAAKSGAVITLPFEVINGYPMVKCQMDGREGLFLFDTGNTGDALSLNMHYFDIEKDKLKKIGEGFYGSGEKFAVYAKQVGSLSCGGLVKKNFQSTLNEMGGPEKAMGGSLLGMIGVSLLLDYEMLIDYSKKTIKLYPLNGDGDLIGKRDVELKPTTVINFDFDKHLPIASAVIKNKDGKKDTRISFDTGSSMNFVKLSLKDSWINEKFVDQSEDKRHFASVTFAGSTKDHRIDNLVFVDRSHMEAAGYKFDITLGYPFLKNQPTIWNFKKKTLTLF